MLPPSPWKAEAAPLYAFYGLGLQGWDASYHFCSAATRLGDGWPGLSKYVSHTPHYMGQFPALAFAVHQGHVREAKVIAARRVSREQVFAGRDALGQSIAQGGHDTKQLGATVTTPPAALAAGKVTVAFGAGGSTGGDLSLHHDEQKKIVTSSTGELVWDYGKRYVQVRTPRTQAVVGFVKQRMIRLPAVMIKSKTPFVSVIFTPLDNRTLATSQHVLITAMARDRQTGSEFNGDWSKLTTLGGPPLLLEPVQARIRLRGKHPAVVRALDIYGVPTDREVDVRADGSFTIDGSYAACYYEVRR